MSIRKTIASGLVATAVAIEKDRTKEHLAAKVKDARNKLAKWIAAN